MNGAPASPAHAPDAAGLRELFRILRRHRLALAASLVVGVAAGLLLASLRTPTYGASALVLVEGRSVPNLAAADLLGGAADARQVGTEMELLRSRALARAVVDSLGLQLHLAEPRGARRGEVFARLSVSPEAAEAEYRLTRRADGRFSLADAETERVLGAFAPGERIRLPGASVVLAPSALGHEEIVFGVTSSAAAVEALTQALEIEQPGVDANLIRVDFRGTDPQLVRDVPNVLTENYIAMRTAIQKSEARSRAALLRAQLDSLGADLTLSEERLREFRERERVVNPQLEASAQIGNLAQLQSERAAVEAERTSLAQLLANLQALEATRGEGEPSPYRRLIAFPSLLRNQATSELLRSLAEVESERMGLAARRTPADPDVQVLDARIAELEQQLKGIASTYLQGLSSQAVAMDATLGEYRARLAETPGNEAQFTRLSAQPEVLREMHGLLQTRLKEAEIAESVEDSQVRVVDPAALPTKPVGLPGGLFGAGAGAFALLLAMGVVVAREYADSTVRTRADVQAALGAPVLGLIPRVSGASRGSWKTRVLPGVRLLPAVRRRAGDAGPGLPAAAPRRAEGAALMVRGASAARSLTDAYGRLHAGLEFTGPQRDSKILIVTSPLPGDGKTTTAINFATTLAEAGLKVLLIDADLRRGRVHEAFDAPRGPGLVNLLSETPELEGVLRRAEVGNGQALRYVTVGTHLVNPLPLLGSPVMRELLRVVAQVYDRVIVDTPPLSLFPDAAVLSGASDGVVVVARAGETPFDALVDTGEQLERAGARTLGAVLNGVDFEKDAVYDRAYEWYRMREEYAETAPVARAVAG